MPTSTSTSKYIRLAESLREQMRSGALKPGDRLPSYLQLQAQYGLAQSTLDRVYRLLENEGLIVRTPKQGIFVAESKRKGRTNVVGVLCGDDIDDNPYYARLCRGVQDVAHAEKMGVLMLYKDSAVQWELLDGLLQWPAVKSSSSLPTITLLNKAPGMPSVGSDDYEAIKTAVAHLVGLGHRRIAFLTLGVSLANDEISRGRLQGYKDALQEAGIAGDRRWMRPLREPWGFPERFLDMGYNQMKRWLQEDWAALGCTALIAQNDETAIGVIRALQEAGVSVPGQVSVVGFDGLDIAEFVHPSLTTLVVPLREIGATAMRMLLRKIDDAPRDSARLDMDAMELMLKSELRIGESTAPPPKN